MAYSSFSSYNNYGGGHSTTPAPPIFGGGGPPNGGPPTAGAPSADPYAGNRSPYDQPNRSWQNFHQPSSYDAPRQVPAYQPTSYQAPQQHYSQQQQQQQQQHQPPLQHQYSQQHQTQQHQPQLQHQQSFRLQQPQQPQQPQQQPYQYQQEQYQKSSYFQNPYPSPNYPSLDNSSYRPSLDMSTGNVSTASTGIGQKYDYLFKFIIIGDEAVGKTCLLLQFTDKRYRLTHEVTVGVEFGSRILNHNNAAIKLQCWDTAGQDRFRSIIRSYYRRTQGALLVYDITNRASFDHARGWLEEAKSAADEDLTITLVGNKRDRAYERQVSYEEGSAFATEQGLYFLETSAVTGEMVDEAFMVTTKMEYEKLLKTRSLDKTACQPTSAPAPSPSLWPQNPYQTQTQPGASNHNNNSSSGARPMPTLKLVDQQRGPPNQSNSTDLCCV